MYVCMYPQKTSCLRSYCLKSLVSVNYCSLVEFNGQKKVTTPGDLFRERNSIICNANKINAEQHETAVYAAVQIYNIAPGTVCTDSAQCAQGMCSVELQFCCRFGCMAPSVRWQCVLIVQYMC